VSYIFVLCRATPCYLSYCSSSLYFTALTTTNLTLHYAFMVSFLPLELCSLQGGSFAKWGIFDTVWGLFLSNKISCTVEVSDVVTSALHRPGHYSKEFSSSRCHWFPGLRILALWWMFSFAGKAFTTWMYNWMNECVKKWCYYKWKRKAVVKICEDRVGRNTRSILREKDKLKFTQWLLNMNPKNSLKLCY
jgi:hypothetical protein